ncbi:hypothetical protein [Actinopolymorpha pittospori]
MADAEKSVVTVLRANVKPGSLPAAAALGMDGKPLADARRSPVRWLQAGTATVTVPGPGEPTKVGSTVVSVTAPGDGGGYLADPMRQPKLRAGGKAPGRVGVRRPGNPDRGHR